VFEASTQAEAIFIEAEEVEERRRQVEVGDILLHDDSSLYPVADDDEGNMEELWDDLASMGEVAMVAEFVAVVCGVDDDGILLIQLSMELT